MRSFVIDLSFHARNEANADENTEQDKHKGKGKGMGQWKVKSMWSIEG